MAIDDASRLAYGEMLANAQAVTTVAFLRRASIYFRRNGVKVKRVMTDNGVQASIRIVETKSRGAPTMA